MAAEIRFRVILPLAQSVSAALFGGFGLWERSAFLGRPVFGNQTLWNSSVASHYWPWTYKFAAVLNFPALLAGLLLGWPFSKRWPSLPEAALFALSIDPHPQRSRRAELIRFGPERALTRIVWCLLSCGLGFLSREYYFRSGRSMCPRGLTP